LFLLSLPLILELACLFLSLKIRDMGAECGYRLVVLPVRLTACPERASTAWAVPEYRRCFWLHTALLCGESLELGTCLCQQALESTGLRRLIGSGTRQSRQTGPGYHLLRHRRFLGDCGQFCPRVGLSWRLRRFLWNRGQDTPQIPAARRRALGRLLDRKAHTLHAPSGADQFGHVLLD
jgi:hypothetical protein